MSIESNEGYTPTYLESKLYSFEFYCKERAQEQTPTADIPLHDALQSMSSVAHLHLWVATSL